MDVPQVAFRCRVDRHFVLATKHRTALLHDGVSDVAGLPVIERARIGAFSRIYRRSPTGREAVELHGFHDAVRAKALLRNTITAFKAED